LPQILHVHDIKYPKFQEPEKILTISLIKVQK